MKCYAVRACAMIVAAFLLPVSAYAQGYPNRVVKVIVPFGTGATSDIVARMISDRLTVATGQPFIVENKPGAGGTIGSSAVAHAEPDGYTILVHSNSYAVIPSTYRNLNYDPVKDMVGVIPLASVPMVLVTSPAKGVRSLPELVKSAKARPDSINYASAGTGGATHLGAERLLVAGGFTGTHVPYKSSGEALTEVIAGRVDFYFSPIGLAQQYIKSDRLVALGVSSTKRAVSLPDVPTTIEAGLPNSNYDVWIGMFAPAKTPRAIINRLNEETAKALRSPELREKYTALVMEPMIMSPTEFDVFLKKDVELNAVLVKAAKIEPN